MFKKIYLNDLGKNLMPCNNIPFGVYYTHCLRCPPVPFHFANRMNPETKRARGFLAFFAGMGGMCGSGYENVLHLLEQSDAEALAGDWRRIGRDWENALAQAPDKIDAGQGKQVALNFPATGLDE